MRTECAGDWRKVVFLHRRFTARFGTPYIWERDLAYGTWHEGFKEVSRCLENY